MNSTVVNTPKRSVGRPCKPNDHVVCFENKDGSFGVFNDRLTRADALSACNANNKQKAEGVVSYFVRQINPATVKINSTVSITL